MSDIADYPSRIAVASRTNLQVCEDSRHIRIELWSQDGRTSIHELLTLPEARGFQAAPIEQIDHLENLGDKT